MKKLLIILGALAISVLGAEFLFGELVSKVEKNGQKAQQIKVNNATDRRLYVAVYTVDNDFMSNDKDKEAAIFSNIYSIEPNKHEVIDRPERKSGVNRNIYFAEEILPYSLTPSSPIRTNRLNVGEGIGQVFGKSKDEFTITQDMLKYGSGATQQSVERTFEIINPYPAKKDDFSSQKDIIYYGVYINGQLAAGQAVRAIQPDASSTITIKMGARDKGLLYFDLNKNKLESKNPSSTNKPLDIQQNRHNTFVVYPIVNNEPNWFGKSLHAVSQEEYDRTVKNELE